MLISIPLKHRGIGCRRPDLSALHLWPVHRHLPSLRLLLWYSVQTGRIDSCQTITIPAFHRPDFETLSAI
jgi:hypothetical protein